LHKPRRLGTYAEFWKRLPRRKSALSVYHYNPDRVAFGIVAEHDISFAMTFSYFILAIIPTLWFWADRLQRSPGDWQNASVPFFTVMAISTPLWAVFVWRFDRA